jgi:hypothetical protein
MGFDPYTNASYETNPYANAQANRDLIQRAQAEQQEKMKYAARMAQQQDRFQPVSGPEVSKPLDLAGVLQAYENLLGGLLEQIDALENRLNPMLLDYPNYPMERDTSTDPVGSLMTTRVYHLNLSLRVATERVARITQSVNL